ncbi:MAG: winged helix DNA-binding domain-containing protein [Clostridiales bacterium]|nr:winged helix DNA-binding domain-containing protein [Clostridiales bacterium]
MTTLSNRQARQFILAKQGLIGEHRFEGKAGAFAFVKQAGCIQFDPVDVSGKNAELTLQSRVRGFTKQMLWELLYKDRLLVDYSDKELSIWPAEDWPYFSSYRERARETGKAFPGLSRLKELALDYIREHGPVSGDTLPVEGEIFWHSSMHWSGNWHENSRAARAVLEQLYTEGELVIHHKQGSRKFYDLAERQLPGALLSSRNPCEDEETFTAWRVLRRIGAAGLLWDKNSAAFLGIGLNAETRRRALEKLESDGRIMPVQVEGIKPVFYCRAEDENLLKDVIGGQADLKPRMEFIAPLDPLMWDKALIKVLWDYQYSWEIYTPADRRKYGYYTLPILFGESFAGRVDSAVDRKRSVLRVNAVWWEPGVKQTKKLMTKFDGTLRRFAGFNGCREIEMR